MPTRDMATDTAPTDTVQDTMPIQAVTTGDVIDARSAIGADQSAPVIVVAHTWQSAPGRTVVDTHGRFWHFYRWQDVTVFLTDADADDEEPDREPSADQERAWDQRDDDARGHALA